MPDTYSFLIVDTYYPQFLSALYDTHSELAAKSYSAQRDFIMSQCFGTADFYSANLKKLGCEAEEIIPNNNTLQKQWAREHGGGEGGGGVLSKLKGRLSAKLGGGYNESLNILKRQIAETKPDILYMQDLSFCPPGFLSEVKPYVRLIVGQIACPLPPPDYLKPYDLILTSFPHYVERFREMGINSEYLKIAFSPSVLDKIGGRDKKYGVTFVGGISPEHKQRRELLAELARRVDIDFFGYGADGLDSDSPIAPRHHGEIWGLDMYRVLSSSKITVNCHISVAERWANNMRLYEATGCGAMLITDYKANLGDLFDVGAEIAAYKNVDELVSLIDYYLKHEVEREAIAGNGQQRTLCEHTYYNRLRDLLAIVSRYI